MNKVLMAELERITKLVTQCRLPAIYPSGEFYKTGGRPRFRDQDI